MNLYILRHASAGVRRADPVIDAKRPLDKEGKEQCLLIARYLNALKTGTTAQVMTPPMAIRMPRIGIWKARPRNIGKPG